MLRIHGNQFKAFKQAALTEFEIQLASRCRAIFPRLSCTLDNDQLHVAISQGIRRANSYGWTNKGPVRLFIEITFLLGSAFDTDPQYPWAARILQSSRSQMSNAEILYEKAIEYQETVLGPNDANMRAALKGFSHLAWQPESLSYDFISSMRQQLSRVFPEKAKYVGEEGLTALICEGQNETPKHILSINKIDALVIILTFIFGHGCTDDPLHPWISSTLKDTRIIDAEVRLRRLQQEAFATLNHILASFSTGNPT